VKISVGELAALGTALCWSFGSILFTIASRKIGANATNRLRLTLALFLFILCHLIIFGKPLPNAAPAHWFWLGLSGFIGFTIGDTLLFRAFVINGPRVTMLLMSLAPIFGTIIAWLFLREILGPAKILAIIITLSGIAWVISGQKNNDQKKDPYLKGILLGLGASGCQTLGLFLSKKGLGNNFSPFSGNLIRLLSATITIWLIPFLQGTVGKTLEKLSDKKGALTMFGGALLGPFLGVWLSLVAIQNTYIGIASTLMALPPIILIPLSHWIFKERITLRAILGTVVAITGVALIFLI